MASYSNCLLGALVAKRRLGGRLGWWPGWSKGWRKLPLHPWGHFYLDLGEGRRLHFSAMGVDLPWWRQLWFRGKFKRSRTRDWL
jgi:hypothetical protein